MLKDAHGRHITYARISLTDKCNLRCRYCMPADGIQFLSNSEILNDEELIIILESLAELGIKKVRFTGGEPLIRPDFESIIFKSTELFNSVNLTTNASLIHKHAQTLKTANLDCINVSLDTLNPARFLAITRRDEFETVWKNLNWLIENQFRVKVNVVVMKGLNDTEIPAFINLAKQKSIEVRFIEVMPFNEHDGNVDYFMSYSQIKQTIEEHAHLEEIRNENSSSKKFKLDRGKATIGIIPAYSRSLCGECNRIRINAKGELLSCLYSAKGTPLKSWTNDKKRLKSKIEKAVYAKEKNGILAEAARVPNLFFESMTSIGG